MLKNLKNILLQELGIEVKKVTNQEKIFGYIYLPYKGNLSFTLTKYDSKYKLIIEQNELTKFDKLLTISEAKQILIKIYTKAILYKKVEKQYSELIESLEGND